MVIPGASSDFASHLIDNAASRGDDIAFRFIGRSVSEHIDITWKELLAAGRRQAGALRDFQGGRIGLLCNRPRDFVVSLAAIFLANAVAVPMPATLNRRSSEHVKAIIAAADLAAIIAPADVLAADWLADARLDRTRRVSLEDMRDDRTERPMLDTRPLDAPLLVQFTSGSTGEPKGVELSQANVLANCSAIAAAYGLSQRDVGLSWLPLHHDMGLVGHVLVPIFLGGRSVLMDPLRFLQKPLSWLEAIGKERATITSAPNFAFELCNLAASRANELSCDLSSLSTAICGGEPVRSETLENFARNFGRVGFRSAAFAPSYGLAEATLLVSTGKSPNGPVRVKRLTDKSNHETSCMDLGAPVAGMRVRIVDPESREERAEREVGEIEIAGSSMGKPVGRPSTEWTSTGDLGFIVGGRLAVSGRLKDVLILRGENLPPTDVEAAASKASSALVPNGIAAIGINRAGTQVMVVVAEVHSREKPALDDLSRKIRELVGSATGHIPENIVFARAGALPRTTSGKLQRSRIADLYEQGHFQAAPSEQAPGHASDV